MKVHAIFIKQDSIVEVGTYNLAECYTEKMIEDYLYVICNEHTSVFHWFIENKNVFGSCFVK